LRSLLTARLMAKENGKEIRVWNVQTGREDHRLKGFKGSPNTMASLARWQISGVWR